MNGKPSRRATPSEQPTILGEALARARAAGAAGVLAFDLDSTLLDNRPRQARIVREWGAVRGVPEAAACRAEHLDGWDLRVALANAGLARSSAEEVHADLKVFWRERFFTSAYCPEDDAIAGAREFLAAVRSANAQVCYLTGRHVDMGAGTVESFRRHGFPVPDERSVHLLLKPTLEMDDDAWKREAYARLGALGRVVACFDNEPIHANAYLAAFPQALVIHLDTDHSGRPVAVDPAIRSVLDFRVCPT